ncbi:MAG: carboxypeptidase regulatory-like domain-containing protein [Planctomycetes bacterium]|nr:carboxypeptidase regulatory-like domain-containing protein [Planctomycetota bacterium]
MQCKYFSVVLAMVANLATFGSRPAFGQDGKSQLQELTSPITISGRATDRNENPVAAAKITVVSTNGIDKWLAETTTDSDGQYVIRDVALPLRQGPQGSLSSGTFQVFGIADGKAIAWHGMRYYHPMPRPAQFPKQEQDHSFFQGEAIQMNLVFRNAKELTGAVKDENGKPVPNVKIHLSTLDYLQTEGHEYHHNFREFWAMHASPAAYHEATTGSDGQFSISGLPEESVVVVRVKHPDYANQMLLAAITDSGITENRYISNSSHTSRDGRPVTDPIWETRTVQTNPLAIKARPTRRALVRILNADDKHPAANVGVSMLSSGNQSSKSYFGTSAFGKTDESGRVELKLPAGSYRLVADPPRNSTYVRTYETLDIDEQPAEQEFDVHLNVGCILILEAIDVDSGSGIPDVSFTHSFEVEPGRVGYKAVQSSASLVDNPVTDAKGELRAVVLPGSRTYRIDPPQGFQCEQPQIVVTCVSGETIRIKFALEKQATK